MTHVEEKPTPPTPEADFTDNELEEIQLKGQLVIEKDPLVQSHCVVMLFAQQLYHCALAALRREELHPAERMNEAVQDYLVKSMQRAAMNPFQRDDLIKKAQAMVLPWLMQELDSEQKRELLEQRKEADAEEIARRADGFELPWPIREAEDIDSAEAYTLPRERSLILHGYVKCVYYLLEQVVNVAKARKMQGRQLSILRLTIKDLPSQAVDKAKRGKLGYVEIGYKQWAGKLGSSKQVHRVLSPWLKWLKRHKVDMVIVDDLSVLTEKREGVHPAYHLNQAHKNLRKWCTTYGSFLVAASPTENHTLSEGEQWNMLDVHTELKMITIERGPDIDDGVATWNLSWPLGAKQFVVEHNIPEQLVKHD